MDEVEERFTEEERQVLIALIMRSLAREPIPQPMLLQALRRLSGTDTVISARRAYPSAQRQGSI